MAVVGAKNEGSNQESHTWTNENNNFIVHPSILTGDLSFSVSSFPHPTPSLYVIHVVTNAYGNTSLQEILSWEKRGDLRPCNWKHTLSQRSRATRGRKRKPQWTKVWIAKETNYTLHDIWLNTLIVFLPQNKYQITSEEGERRDVWEARPTILTSTTIVRNKLHGITKTFMLLKNIYPSVNLCIMTWTCFWMNLSTFNTLCQMLCTCACYSVSLCICGVGQVALHFHSNQLFSSDKWPFYCRL